MLRIAEDQITGSLISWLRNQVGSLGLSYAEAPTKIRGNETLIYGFSLDSPPVEISGELILRLFWRDADPERARREAATHAVLRDLGYPVPRVVLTCPDAAVLGAPFLVMERAAGRPMLDWYTKFPHCLRIADRVVALQRRLHTFDTERMRSAFAQHGVRLPLFDLAASLERLSLRVSKPGLEWTRPGLDWLIEHQPAPASEPVICHGDLHPGNILGCDTEVSAVIDWSSVKVADAALDIGWTRQMLTGRSDLPPLRPRKLLAAVQRLVLILYDRAHQHGGQADTNAVAYYEALRSFGRGTSRAASASTRGRQQKGFASFRRVTGIALPMIAR